jgi:hypothetical protein
MVQDLGGGESVSWDWFMVGPGLEEEESGGEG